MKPKSKILFVLILDPQYYEEDRRQYREPPIPKARQKYPPDESKYNKRYEEEREYQEEQQQQQRYKDEFKRKQKHQNIEIKPRQKHIKEEYFEITRKNPDLRQRSPSPPIDVTPRDRFKDAKEKFLLLEKERLEQERKLRSDNHREKNHVRRNESLTYQNSNDKYER